jgi:hypothetical protein
MLWRSKFWCKRNDNCLTQDVSSQILINSGEMSSQLTVLFLIGTHTLYGRYISSSQKCWQPVLGIEFACSYEHALRRAIFFPLSFLGARGYFLCSHHIPNVFSIAPHFIPYNLPKVLPLSLIEVVQRRGLTSSQRNSYSVQILNFHFSFHFLSFVMIW